MKKPTSRQKKLLQEYKKSLSLSETLFEIAIGTMLGDASLQSQDKEKTYRLKYSQSIKNHTLYLNHLYNLWKDWCLSESRKEKNRAMLSFQTISHVDLKKLADIFLVDKNGILCISFLLCKKEQEIKPDFVQNYLTPRALAYWFMDDGGRSCYNKDFERKGFTFNTHGFEKDHVELLCLGLKQRYNLDCWVTKNKGKFCITISAYCYSKIISLIKPYIIPSMFYKVPGFCS